MIYPKQNVYKIKLLVSYYLVFLFEPLADSYTKPIAVFVFKGPVNGLTV